MRITLLALCSGTVLALGSGAASAQQQFNGSWSVEVIPQSGSCQRTYRFPVVIRDGQVRYGGSDGIAASGTVTSAVTSRAASGRDQSRPMWWVVCRDAPALARGYWLAALAARGNGGPPGPPEAQEVL